MNDQSIHIIGIDLGKNWFHLVAMDERGKPVYRKKLNRGQLGEFIGCRLGRGLRFRSCEHGRRRRVGAAGDRRARR